MFMNITCPTCSHKWRVPERVLGQQVKCPACAHQFQCGLASPPSLKAIPLAPEKASEVRRMPQSRAAHLLSTASIHYCCPRCQKPLESPTHLAGQKLNCPDCGQRLQIPQPSSMPSPLDNQTMLASEELLPTSRIVFYPLPDSPHSQAEQEPILTVLPAFPQKSTTAVRREYCLECGVEVTQRARVQSCPDCGSLFCSARCYRDHGIHAHPSRRH